MEPRLVTPGAMVALTRRATLRQAFLAPWDPAVGESWLYSLAWAQQKTGLAVHQTALVANHHHTAVTPTDRELAEATRSAHRDMSFAVNELLLRHRQPVARAVFDPRQTNWTTCVDVEAEIKRLLYDAMNVVAAGLVERPEQMPWGHYFGFDQWLKGPITVKRPALRHFKRRPEELTLELTPPAKLYRAFRGDLPKLVAYLNEELEHQIADVEIQRGGRPARGLEELFDIDPWSKPKTLAEARWQRVPTWAVGAEGQVGKQRRVRSSEEV
ncbi:MAG: hypothetical protein KF901_19405, partial [Myxococcales bacterium]|nr:hypothetical protein [Myxococcales bacterium]